jgi:hypothetical protein
MKRLSPTTGTTNTHYVPSDKKRNVYYNSYSRKDTIMRYTQIVIAAAITLLVCMGLFNLSN